MVLLKEEDEDQFRKSIPSYYDVKKKERELAEIVKAKEYHELFEKALGFYNENYPKSFRKLKIKWKIPKRIMLLTIKKIFTEEIKELSIEDKLHARYVLLYNIKEHNYKKVDTYYKYNELRGILKSQIPGGNILDKIEEIEMEQHKKDAELEVLKRKYSELLLEDKIEKQVKKTPIIICELCGKECSSPAGLASHMRNKHPNQKDTIQEITNPIIKKED